jgi:hypothetical protein
VAAALHIKYTGKTYQWTPNQIPLRWETYCFACKLKDTQLNNVYSLT